MGLEPICLAAQEPKSCMSANSIKTADISAFYSREISYFFIILQTFYICQVLNIVIFI